MAMLAGPRRKQKVINLRAKNNAWSNDSGKFGQRMLEKMGWCEGKGLGAKENGIVEHVVARYKNDEKGLGFEDRNDQWTKHEDDFNALLSNLSSGDNNDEKLHSGVSLEVKSKKSKARVHYHKFTRGKDLTRYSEKDLANIFGKKSLKNEVKPEEKQPQDIQTNTEQVFREKGSMEDYFKNKLAAFKSKNQYNICNSKLDVDDDGLDYSFKGFSGTSNSEEYPDKHQEIGFQSSLFISTDNNNVEKENSITDNSTVESTKKNKKKKNKNVELDNIANNQKSPINSDNESNIVLEQQEKVKKSKKKKHKELEGPELVAEEILQCKQSKKKTVIVDTIDNHVDDNYVPKKKKKRKNKKDD